MSPVNRIPDVQSVTHGPATGPRVVLLPGNDLGAEFYAPLAEVIARAGASVTCLTLPGALGEAPLPALGWAALVDAVAPLVDGDTTLVGHSLGGMLAWQVAARRRVRRLVLLEPAIPPGRRAAAIAARRYSADVVNAERNSFVNWSGTFWRVADFNRFPTWAIEHYERARRERDVDTAATLVRELPELYPLPEVGVPVHVVRGKKSGWVARVNATYLALKFPGVRHTALSNVAHWMANEDDEAVAAAILAE